MRWRQSSRARVSTVAWIGGHDDGGELRTVRAALLPRPGCVLTGDRRQGPRAHRLRARGGPMRVGAAVGQRRHRRAAGVHGPGRRRRPGPRRAEPAAPRRGQARVEAVHPAARAAHEAHRGGLHQRGEHVRDLLQRAAAGGLPRACSRLGRQAEGPGGAAPDRAAGRGAPPGRHRAVRARPVLRHVPEGLRAGVGPDGEGPGPARQPAADRGGVRAADVLPEVRASAVPGLPQGRTEDRQHGGNPRRPRHRGGAQRAVGHGRGQARRGRHVVRLPAGERVRVPSGLRGVPRDRQRTFSAVISEVLRRRR